MLKDYTIIHATSYREVERYSVNQVSSQQTAAAIFWDGKADYLDSMPNDHNLLAGHIEVIRELK